MGCGESVVKYILFVVNLFVALAGLLLLGLGVAVELKVTDVIHFLEENQLMKMAPISAIVLGGMIFVIAFLGCCGAVRKSNCMLVTYSIFMLVLMILKITMAVLIFVKWNYLMAQIPRWLEIAFKTDRKAFHELEKLLRCCSPKSYYFPHGLLQSHTCCDPTGSSCITVAFGCSDGVIVFLYYYGTMVGVGVICVVMMELVVVVFAMCLANHIRRRSRGEHY